MTSKILIFDSGVGGLSILQEIAHQLPQAAFHYLMDNAAFPYGTKDDRYLTQRILSVCTQAVQQLQPDLLVIACNTASTLALAELRASLTLPIVGVVPAIKVAAQLAHNQDIGLIATVATVKRPYTEQLINQFAPDKRVHKLGSDLLVTLAEDYINLQSPPSLSQLQQHLEPWFQSLPPLTHVVLGCTHFPLLKAPLQKLWPAICWVDSAAAIARQVQRLLPTSTTDTTPTTVSLYWTAPHYCRNGVTHYLQQQYSLAQMQLLALSIPSYT